MLIHQRNVLPILLVLYLLMSFDGVQGEIKLSKLEELSLEKQLKLLNKPAVKTIKTTWGDTYDCVDFYKQPAFDHPLLKNHNFHPEMKPTLSTIKQTPSNSTIDISRTWIEKNGCPSGTVPIRRVTKDDLIRQRRMPSREDFIFEAPLDDTNIILEERGVNTRAIVKTPDDSRNKFAGAGMVASLWNPSVEGAQNSACRLKIQKGPDSMQAGWRVDPTLYGDNKTRLFIHFQAGDRQCFDILCPGFVLINSEIVLNIAHENVALQGAPHNREITLYIVRDLTNGNWWLLYGENQDKVGFWPRDLFTSLQNDFVENVEWGGVTYTPPNSSNPPMGSGFFPEFPDPSRYAYCRGLVLLNDKGETINAEKTLIFLDNQSLYKVLDRPYYGTGKFPHYVFYGGPNVPKEKLM
ncbi:hypothetical protein P3L10_000374 [Capsicum annuum]|uniref:uncharacterized protein LOC107858599 n=1 Tax=Capsicum annuum TaxID=4072 RepID=UPI001FB08708|nr:uncharacterized protein LOC107858599 [Capsicum annuum]